MVGDLAEYIGIPYRSRGANADEGLDCWGLVCLYYRQQFQIGLPTYLDGPRAKESGVPAFVHQQLAVQWQATSEPALGDLLVLNVLGRPFHVGIWIGNQKMLHTLDGHASVIERIDSPKWASRIEGFYRYV